MPEYVSDFRLLFLTVSHRSRSERRDEAKMALIKVFVAANALTLYPFDGWCLK